MKRGRPGHRIGETKCDTCGHVITNDNAVWMLNRLRGRCKNCFSHEKGGNDKRMKLFDGTESTSNPFGGRGKVLMRQQDD